MFNRELLNRGISNVVDFVFENWFYIDCEIVANCIGTECVCAFSHEFASNFQNKIVSWTKWKVSSLLLFLRL